MQQLALFAIPRGHFDTDNMQSEADADSGATVSRSDLSSQNFDSHSDDGILDHEITEEHHLVAKVYRAQGKIAQCEELPTSLKVGERQLADQMPSGDDKSVDGSSTLPPNRGKGKEVLTWGNDYTLDKERAVDDETHPTTQFPNPNQEADSSGFWAWDEKWQRFRYWSQSDQAWVWDTGQRTGPVISPDRHSPQNVQESKHPPTLMEGFPLSTPLPVAEATLKLTNDPPQDANIDPSTCDHSRTH